MSGRGAGRDDVERPLQWDVSAPLREGPLSGTFGLHATGIPDERPSRRKRLLCFGFLAAAVLGVLIASVVVGSERSGSSSGAPVAVTSDGATAAATAVPEASSAAAPLPSSSGGGGTKEGSSADQGMAAGAQQEAGGAPAPDSAAAGSRAAGSPPVGGRGHSMTRAPSPAAGKGGAGRGMQPPSVRKHAATPAKGGGARPHGGGHHAVAGPPPPAPTAEALGTDWDVGGDGWSAASWADDEFAAAAPSPSGEGGAAAAGAGDSAPDPPLYTVRFLAVGDWGRQGKTNQSEVAQLMGRVAAADPPAEFVVSTGDNFYQHGLQSPTDALFAQSFSQVYTADALQVPWYAVLGNHDYCDSAPNCGRGLPTCKYSPLHQMNIALSSREASRRWHLKRYYTQSFADGKVQLFFIDTSPFIRKYYDRSNTWSHCTGGLWTQSWEEQLLLLEQELAASGADWKLAVGHHPTYSNGHHGNNTELIQHLQPLFQKYGVQAYFTGHDHNLEHLAVDGYNVIVTGAGSETDREQVAAAYSHYYYQYSGFVSVTAQPQALTVEFFTLEDDAVAAHTSLIGPDGKDL